MRIFWWIFWFLWGSLLMTLNAYPIGSPIISGSGDVSVDTDSFDRHWHWFRYTFGLLTITVTVFVIVGCLCCRKHRNPKGFQEKEEKCEQEFKDGNTASRELTFENPVSGLELEISQTAAVTAVQNERVHFEPLPLDRLIPDAKIKPKPPHPAPFPSAPSKDQDPGSPIEPCNEWFDSTGHHIPRERLKYLREIGRGWFGKVVEGRADFESPESTVQNKGVIVRILTDEATTKEKSWFLGEATPYLRLRHQNILALLGSCLETDPYLLLFESCPPGDLKGFLRSNRDSRSRDALTRGKVPTRMAVEIAAGLMHMHNHGFSHTDLSARNCLVASDLSVKLGDYGTGIEKYPSDYYVIGDKALPIRWAAPESLKCTDTTIETREITAKANLWSYAVLLWEISSWGERPYDDSSDEKVIRMVLSSADDEIQSESGSCKLLLNCLEDCPQNLYHAMQMCWTLDPNMRPSLDRVQQVLLGAEDFDLRWQNLRPNMLQEKLKSASLQNLHGSIDSDKWLGAHSGDDRERGVLVNDEETPRTSFRLGPGEPVKNVPGSKSNNTVQESGSDTEEESWRGKVERGAYTEKVRQKSKSVADLMVLVHIDSDSDADWSIGVQGPEKCKKRITAAGSDSNLKSAVLADEFDEALRKLRNPLPSPSSLHPRDESNTSSYDFPAYRTVETDNPDKSNVLTLTTDVQERPMLRLSFPTNKSDLQQKESEPSEENHSQDKIVLKPERTPEHLVTDCRKETFNDSSKEKPDLASKSENALVHLADVNQESTSSEEHILRLVSKEEPCPPLLRFVPDVTNSSQQAAVTSASTPESQASRISNPNLEATPSIDFLSVNELQSAVDTLGFSNNFDELNVKLGAEALKEDLKGKGDPDVALWNQILDSALERKIPGFVEDNNFNKEIEVDTDDAFKWESQTDEANTPFVFEQSPVKAAGEKEPVEKPMENDNTSRELIMELLSSETLPWKITEKREVMQGDEDTMEEMPPRLLVTTASVPDTPSRTDDSIENVEDDSSNTEDLDAEERKPLAAAPEGEDCKRLSTPDDERSSDSGFRDKESCEEEESPPPLLPALSSSTSAEEEQLQVLSELDAILDAESYGTLDLESAGGELLSPDSIERKITDLDEPDPDDCEQSYDDYANIIHGKGWFLHPQETAHLDNANNINNDHTCSNLNQDVGTVSSREEEERFMESERSANDSILNDNDVTINYSEKDSIGSQDGEVFMNGDAYHSASTNDLVDLEVEENEEENSSTASLRSDNSYVSFGLDEEFVAAIRNELREKLPRAQMAVEEAAEPRDDEDLALGSSMIVSEHESWDDEDDKEAIERGNGVVDISIRYNVYNAPLSPILEERESAVTSESLVSKEDSYDESFASKELGSRNDTCGQETGSGPADDLLLVNTQTNEAILLDGGRRDLLAEMEREDQDTSNADISDEENFDYTVPDSMRSQEKRSRIMVGSGAPLPSPEDELKWQQLPLPFPLSMQDDLMSTSFATEQDWDSQDDDDEDDDDEDDEEDSSSSGEFVWKEGERHSPTLARTDASSQRYNDLGIEQIEGDEGSVDQAEEGEEEEEEFTPSAWDATLAPHRSALRSPDKTQRPSDQKKSVWFKKQRYHCVYEYPKETSSSNSHKQPAATTTNWEPTSYADWEEMMEEPRLDLYPLDYDVTDHSGEEEFYVSSSNRPFQFQTGDGEQVSQFFPGAASTLLQQQQQQHQQQLGELRHTRDRLKLNLPTNGTTTGVGSPDPAVDGKQETNERTVTTGIEENKEAAGASISCNTEPPLQSTGECDSSLT